MYQRAGHISDCRTEIVSLYDHSGYALKPWARAGYTCYAYDIANLDTNYCADCVQYCCADLYDAESCERIIARHQGKVKLLSAFPPCTDLAASGSKWWKRKQELDADFQRVAAERARRCALMAEAMGCSAWYVENPVGMLSRLWRGPDAVFCPCDYGGYLHEHDAHPDYPAHIPARDAYSKRTCIWHGSRFVMPRRRRVKPTYVTYKRARNGKRSRYSPQATLGKGSNANIERFKRIRSVTPRGWAQAVFEANRNGHYFEHVAYLNKRQE